MKAHQLRGHGALDSSQGRPAVARKQGESAQENRFFCHPICSAEQLPEWGTTKVIIFFAIGEKCAKDTSARGAQRSVMMKPLFRKGSHFPSLHPCCHDRNPVQPPGRIRDIAADLLETLTPEKLAWPSHVVLAFEAVSG